MNDVAGRYDPAVERISISAAVRRFNVARPTLNKWIRDGQVEATKQRGPSGPQWMITIESLASRVEQIEPRTIAGRYQLEAIRDLERRIAAVEDRLDRLEN